MKFATTLAFTAATAASIALAQPHAHQHKHVHQHKRDVTVTANVPGPTVYAYEVGGHLISLDQVCQGIADGELKFANGQGPPGVCSSTTSTTTSTTTTTTTAAATITVASSSPAFSSSATTTTTTTTTMPSGISSNAGAGKFYEQSSWISSVVPTTSATSAASSAAASSNAPSSYSPATISTGSGIGAAFPDGQLDCSSFPSQYGAVSIDYLSMGGWIGLQAVTVSGNAVTNIVTGLAGQVCSEGMMCSYACPPGYQKSQWPSTQGSTGQSVGGLSCSGGKLHLTNPGLSSSLCIQGTGGVQATNNAGQVVAICRTDYPGTESETVPTELSPGGTQPLTCPEASSYYVWEGQSTSAQYYLNPPGYSASQACQWGSPGSPIGNYAPINLGVGKKDGTTWLSIMANKPTTTAIYPGTVEIQGNISGSCKYTNGQFCSATGCNSDGCTVSLSSGTATYVISS